MDPSNVSLVVSPPVAAQGNVLTHYQLCVQVLLSKSAEPQVVWVELDQVVHDLEAVVVLASSDFPSLCFLPFAAASTLRLSHALVRPHRAGYQTARCDLD